MKPTLLAAFCSFDLTHSIDHFVLIPEGIFRSEIDGRPFDAPHWELTPERGQQIAVALNQRKIDMVIDYEHATLKSKNTGDPAPAAGWLKSAGFTYIQGVGLCSTDFEWLDKAKAHIEAKEYKYISPVFLYSKTGEICALINVALTNTPALDQLPEAKLAAAAQEFITQFSIPQDSEMNEELLKQVRYLLNLPLTTTAEEAVAALEKLKSMLLEKTGVSIAENSQSLFDVITAFEELKVAANSQSTPDLTQFVPLAVYSEAIAKANNVNAAIQAKEIEDLITAACSDGRLTGEATITYFKEQAKTNPEFVKTQIESLPKIAALTQTQTSTIDLNKQQQQQPDALQNEVFGVLGLTAADVEKYGAA
ncbi:phage protease [Acinetobacter bereziniae]|uniref:phage protease n=1 Tax=Acinetobacter bereziniae TaxID=106648 RepID=UPI003009A1B3